MKDRGLGAYEYRFSNCLSYPPAFIACGNTDPFLPQAQELIAALEQSGVPLATYLPGSDEEPLWHEYQRNLASQAGEETMSLLLQFLQEQSAAN
jgi:acetyl esterase/lipase